MTQVWTLEEYRPRRLPHDALTEQQAEFIYRSFGDKVAIEAPSFKTEQQWQLTNLGWVGYIPLGLEQGLVLQPKVTIGNVFAMMEYAYRLKSFRFLSGEVQFQALNEVYEYLAMVLAKRVLDRGKRGFYRSYDQRSNNLQYVRGRLDVPALARSPWNVNLKCSYQEHIADIRENQIIAWTLHQITRSGLCSSRLLPTIRKAGHALLGWTTLKPMIGSDCLGVLYNRLNQDYQPMHALCRFFLEQQGPSQELGDRTLMPFLVDMAALYELFVAEWLKLHLPEGTEITQQMDVRIGGQGGIHFKPDMVLADERTHQVKLVLDTKYKAPDKPATDDVFQVVAYAEALACTEAILVYPKPLKEPLDTVWGSKIRVRSVTFTVDGDLELAGKSFLGELGLVPRTETMFSMVE